MRKALLVTSLVLCAIYVVAGAAFTYQHRAEIFMSRGYERNTYIPADPK